ncbi:MAG: hydantoin utilization protein B [Candidatus Rokubacteria bacterium RIFCSPHIGHO2_12_FULL_73_22]|nr:MAG: hydantoin utilization protein B [Candidatus Rokubacteria bacterium RIFCSPHIGHO2_12_FULL_73_22]OGL11801.1 MAG: hydantoin utilization protein B [Candidatus Rokubacteria bacterium RIFCSPLOWO2_02_FULL_73_56]OGL26743.1 MAG: hydantoin utilization protein B [Candidatus Rokubacteria bacterium RIFCSPLOWO2_12_FULL_73_47]
MSAVDPVLASVLQRRLRAITQEMGLTLLRTTRSPILNEARDFVTGLYDAQGRILEQAEYIPILAFALAPACRAVLEAFGDDVHPGDVFLHNDVFSGGNQHNDVAVFRPVFHEGRLVAWAATKGHQADIGGAQAGGYNPKATEVWQEALRIPPLRIVERGRPLRDVWRLVLANVRLPIVAEDLRAQIGGTVVGERGVLEVYRRHGAATVERHLDFLFDAAERRMRSELRRIPDGTYRGESTVFYDGHHPGSRHRIVVTIDKRGSDIAFDYTGTDPQTVGFVNAPYASSFSAAILTLLMLVDPDLPHNAGILRPLRVHIPRGTILNAEFPAATTFGNTLAGPHSDAIFRALAPALPDRVSAGWNRMLGMTVTGLDPRRGRRYVDILFLALKGGSGAVRGLDGYDHIGLINTAGGLLAQDYEMLEVHTPHRLRRHEYLPDSAGPGRWRGGLGVETEFEVQGADVTGVVFGDGVDEEARAFGLFGGGPGALNAIELATPDGAIVVPRSKDVVAIPRGTVFRQRAGGGGGFGEPRERPAETVAAEVRDGVLSPEAARRDYGVEVHPGTFAVERVTGRPRP